MANVWTHGIWTVKDGREDEFVAAWRELVPLGLGLGAGDPNLLRDRERTRTLRFLGRVAVASLPRIRPAHTVSE